MSEWMKRMTGPLPKFEQDQPSKAEKGNKEPKKGLTRDTLDALNGMRATPEGRSPRDLEEIDKQIAIFEAKLAEEEAKPKQSE